MRPRSDGEPFQFSIGSIVCPERKLAKWRCDLIGESRLSGLKLFELN